MIELDLDKRSTLAQQIDMGGADKMLKFPGGGLAFLAQRFRRSYQARYDDFTLRESRPSGRPTEWGKLLAALTGCGFLAGYYVYGHVNEREDGFIRMRILKLRELLEALSRGEFLMHYGNNPDGSSTFAYLPFKSIPAQYLLLDFTEGDSQGKLL